MDKEQLKQLLDQGKISQATYDSAVSKLTVTPSMEPMPVAPAMQPVTPTQAVAQPIPGPMVAPTPAPIPEVQPEPIPEPIYKQVETGSKQTTTTTQAVKSPEAKKAEADYIKSIEDQKKAQEAIAATAQAKAAEEFALTQEREKLNAEQMIKRQEATDKATAEYEARLNKIDADVAAMKDTKYEGFWAKKDTGSKILGAIAVAMGAYSSSLGGGPNYALNIIQKAADDDFAQFKQGIDQQISAIQQSRLSLENKEKLTKQKLDALDAYSLAQNEQIKNKIGALGSKFAGSDAQNKLQELNAKLDENTANKRLEIADKYKQNISTTVEKEMIKTQVDAKGNMINAPTTKEQTEIVGDINKSTTKLSPIRSELADALKTLKDPKVSKDDKIRLGQGLIKTLNSKQGSDAIGAEEAKRLASELESSLGGIIKGAAIGAGGGATAGSVIPGAGTVVGGIVGTVAGGAYGLAEELQKPGGLKLGPDVEGFTKRVEVNLNNLDAIIKRNDRVSQLIKKGYTVSQANSIIDKEQEVSKKSKGSSGSY